jgi:hypothetical protein
MRIDNLQEYVRLRRELTNEKASIESRLQQINEALGEATIGQTRSQRIQPFTSAGRGRKPAAGTSLRSLVIEVLGSGPKTKEEVLEAVQQRGYRFSTNNPMNSLGVILYGKTPKFNRVDGRFSLGAGARTTGTRAGGGSRQMSAAARARIAEAQKKRWAASRKSGSNGTSVSTVAKPARRQMSPAARKKIAEIARKRWAAVKAAGKSRL